MLAAVCTAYGGPEVVQVREVPAPIVKPADVLVRVHATTVASGDARVRGSRFPSGFLLPARLAFGITKPRQPILGTELAGVVAAVGSSVTRFKPGDRVIAMSGARFGCHAELKTVHEHGPIAIAPVEMPFEQAATIAFGGTTALHFLRVPGRLEPGERVLVIGASGAVGIAAVQLARHFGAHVTAVCSAANIEIVRSLGANQAIDYTATDFTRSGERWDVIFDTVCDAPVTRLVECATDNGRVLRAAAGLRELLGMPFRRKVRGITVSGGMPPERSEDLAELGALHAAGHLRAVIDGTYPLAQITQAHARVDTGRKVGSVVITVR